MRVKREQKPNYLIIGICLVFLFYFGLRLATQLELNDGEWSFDLFTLAGDQMFTLEPISFNRSSITLAGILTLFGFMIYETIRSSYKKNMQEEAYGSAKWNDPSFTKKIREKDFFKNQIFTSTEIVSKDMDKTNRNRNCTVVGRPGTGKSRYFLIPNILSARDETLIITDPKEELLKSCGHALKAAGYDIKVLNLRSKWRGDQYNPLKYIRKLPKEAIFVDLDGDTTRQKQMEQYYKEGHLIAEDDVMSLINNIMDNTKSQTIESNTGDPFWEKAEMVFLQALFYYVIFNYPLEERNFTTILKLIREGDPDDKGNSKLREKFELWARKDPNNIGVKQWQHFVVSARSPKMMSTIVMTASARLAPFNLREVEHIVSNDTMELGRIGKPLDSPIDENGKRTDGRIAYFIVTPATDSTFNFIANLLYSQIFTIIDQNAEAMGGRLATPCNIYMDEFRQLGEIPHFLETWAYVRGLDCGITIILQGLQQMKRIYKDEWQVGLDCCDYFLFLGAESQDTLEYLNKMLGEQTLYKKSTGKTRSRQDSTTQNWDVYGRDLAKIDELMKKENGYAVLHIAGTDPFFSKLYDLKKHPRYSLLCEQRIESGGYRNTEYRKTEEWKINHEKLYNHLEEMKLKRKEEAKTKQMLHQEQLVKQIGLNCEILAPYEVKTGLTIEDVEREYGKGGYRSSFTARI